MELNLERNVITFDLVLRQLNGLPVRDLPDLPRLLLVRRHQNPAIRRQVEVVAHISQLKREQGLHQLRLEHQHDVLLRLAGLGTLIADHERQRLVLRQSDGARLPLEVDFILPLEAFFVFDNFEFLNAVFAQGVEPVCGEIVINISV